MKFNISDYQGKYAVWCKTEEEARDFCNYMYSVKRDKWGSFLSNTHYDVHKSHTAYNLSLGLYGEIDNFIEAGYTILEWSDFMKEFTKADLKTGDIIKQRDGCIGIFNTDLDMIITKKSWLNLDSFNEDLTQSICKDFDIVAVRRPQEKSDCQFDAFYFRWGTLVYERKEPEEMTLAQVCKLLGKEIKIVK